MAMEPSSRQTDDSLLDGADEPSEETSEDGSKDAFLAELARIPRREPPPNVLPVPRAGETVGRFVIHGEIGRGGMGVVYAAKDPTLGREVALKVLFVADRRQKQRLLREARAAAALGHGSVVAIYDVGEDRGRAFIAMERLRGATLRAQLDGKRLSSNEAARFGKDLARALAKAHAQGLVHRDLKPENVMIEPDGRVVLLDFGLVKATFAEADPTAMKTEEGVIVGTPSYMSPEQARGRSVDARSDVFSFGVMLYEMTTGRRPFVGKNAGALLDAIEQEEPTRPRAIAEAIDPALERVILRCLHKDPSQRYEDAGEIADELERTSRLPKQTTSRAAIVAMAAVLLGLFAVVFAAARSSSTKAGAEPSVRLATSATAPAAMALAMALPDPPSQNAEAVAAYRRGLEALRSGGAWGPDFQRAIALDPSMAAAHVQIAAIGMAQHIEGVRESFHNARLRSDSLSPRDRALLDAIEPVVQREPANWAETNRRLAAALATYPNDAELWYLLSLGHANYDDFEKAVEHARKAFELDPKFARAIANAALSEAYRGRFDEAQKAIDECLAATPGALPCLSIRARLESHVGRCDAMEATARQMIAERAEPHIAYPVLAGALAAKGDPLPTVREALFHAAKEMDALPKGTADLVRDRLLTTGLVRAAELAGDFDEALAQARILEGRVASSPRRNDHGAVARDIASILLETDKRAEAGRVALDYLDRQDAWEPDPSAEDAALARDATPALLVIARRAGVLSREKVATRRRAWLAAWSSRVTPVARSYLWLHGFAATTLDAEDARAALEAQATYGATPPFVPQTMTQASVGLTFFLTGHLDEAKTWLEQACRACTALSFPIEHTRAHLWLGRAREASGDVPGACAAYETVLDRWGHAKPRSVSADEARERSARLGCAKR